MPDEIGTEATRPDAPSADDALFGDSADKADDTAATVAEEQDTQGSDATGEPAVAEEQDADKEGAQDGQDTGDAGEAGEAEAAPSDELKVVVSIKGGRAVIGVQQPASDPHIETFDDVDESALAQEVPAVIERARARGVAEAPRLRAARSPAQTAQQAGPGDGPGRERRDRDGPGTADAEALLGSLSAKHGGGRRSHCDGLPRPSICAAFFAFQAGCASMYGVSFHFGDSWET